MKFIDELTRFIGEEIGEVVLGVLFFVYAFGCFWMFDHLHISKPETQNIVGVSMLVLPLLGLAFWLKRRGTIK